MKQVLNKKSKEHDLGRVWQIPEFILKRDYKGCGNGWIELDRNTGEITKLAYAKDISSPPLEKQNIDMADIDQNFDTLIFKDRVRVRVNFSCKEAMNF